jgi:phosphatidylglycerophosphate synthase
MGVFIIPISVGLYFSSDFLSIVFAFSLVLINIFDTSDGEVARFSNKTSLKGVFYDKFFQIFADTILLFSLTMKFFNYSNKLIFTLIFIYLIVYFLNTYLKRLSEIYLDASDKISKKGCLKSFLSNISSNTFFFHTLWLLFVLKMYLKSSLFDIIAILYFLNLIILNLIKSFYIFSNIRSKI